MTPKQFIAAIVIQTIIMIIAIFIACRFFLVVGIQQTTATFIPSGSPYQAYCETIGSDGQHPLATQFCQNL